MILIYIKYALTKLSQHIKKIFPVVAFLLLSVVVVAQSNKIVRGLIKDSSNRVLPDATVSLFVLNVHRDTLRTISNEKGEFVFNNVKENDFKIQVTIVSYADFSK